MSNKFLKFLAGLIGLIASIIGIYTFFSGNADVQQVVASYSPTESDQIIITPSEIVLSPTQETHVVPIATSQPETNSQYPILDANQCRGYPLPSYETTFTKRDEALWFPYRSSPVINPKYDMILGPFGNESVTLTLSNLNALDSHSEILIVFDLHIILSWDGNAYRDFWGLNVDGNPVFLTTFDNWKFDNDPTHTQDFPNQYSGSQYGAFPPSAYSISRNTLGLVFDQTKEVIDSTYSLCFRVTHSSDNVSIEFFGNELENAPGQLEDESWALDNVAIYRVP